MSSTLLADFLEVFDAGLELVGGGTTLVNGDKTAQAIVRMDASATFGQMLRETVSGTATCKASEIGELHYEACVSVGGQTCYVTQWSVDVIGCLCRFSFTSTAPLSGELQ